MFRRCDGEGVPAGHGTVQEEVHLDWVELLAYLRAKYGGDFERFRQTDLDAVVEKLKSGSAMEEIAKAT